MVTGNDGERFEALVADIDIEDRLHRVKLAAGRPRLRRRLARLTGELDRTDGMLLAAAGSACATTVVLSYLWWRDGRRPHRRRIRLRS